MIGRAGVALSVLPAIALAGCSFPPDDKMRRRLLDATFDEIESVPSRTWAWKFDRRKLPEDCCTVYSDFGEHRIRDIDASGTVASYIVAVSWGEGRGRHTARAHLDAGGSILEFTAI